MFKFNKGFTLIEILVGISIVSILSGTVLLNLSGVRDTAQDTVQDFSITTQVAELERQKIKSRSAEVRAKIQEIQDSLRQIEEADKVLKISTSTSQQKQVATQKKQESTARLNEQKEELVDLTEKEKKVVNKRGGGNPFSLGFITQLPKEFKFDSKIDFDFNNEEPALYIDKFGASVAITPDGNTLVVGAIGRNRGVRSRGAVYIFQKDSNDNFVNPKKIGFDTPGLGGPNRVDDFGTSVAIAKEGSTVVVGAPASGGGVVHILTKNSGGNFASFKRINNSTAGLTVMGGYGFGKSVAITPNGKILVVGAPYGDIVGEPRIRRGAVYIFTQKDASDNFINPKKISSNTTGLSLKRDDYFGTSVSITPDGKTLVVSAWGDDTAGNDGGVVYIFTEKDLKDEFINPEKIFSNNVTSRNLGGLTFKYGYRFGNSVAITPDGNTLVIGENHGDRVGGSKRRGIVYIFTKDVGGNFINTKTLDSNTTGLSLKTDDAFGTSVAITKDGNTLVVGAASLSTGTGDNRKRGFGRGAVYIFKKK